MTAPMIRPMSAPITTAGEIVGVVLAAGEGRRLRPLTFERPKPLCPVVNVALVDHAIARVRMAVGPVAVNVHHGRAAMEHHLASLTDPAGSSAVHVSIEADRALGTAGALGHLRPWIAGRAVLVVNADAWCRADLASFVAGWDGHRLRMMVAGRAPFGPTSAIIASLMPWSAIAVLEPIPSGLYETTWAAHAATGEIDTVHHDGPFTDCGTPQQYLAANLDALDAMDAMDAADEPGFSTIHVTAQVTAGARVGRSAVGAGATVAGRIRDSVIWPGAAVARGEVLERAIRTAEGRTVLVR